MINYKYMEKYISQYNLLKKTLKITKTVSVRFSSTKPAYYQQYQDTACTALARCLIKKKNVFIDRQHGQLCPGGNYFLGIKKYPKNKICDIYVKAERVFKNNKACLSFLKKIPAYPGRKAKYILLSPLETEPEKPDLIIIQANPAQAARILGLAVYKKINYPAIIPAAPACLSLYAPLASGRIHLNLIDYYDRYYQGKQNDKLIWNDKDMLISLPFTVFTDILSALPLSGQGSFRPRLKPQKTAKI